MAAAGPERLVLGIAANVEAIRVRRSGDSSRPEDTYHMTTFSPSRIVWPASSVSAVAVRAKWANAGNMRSDSSTALGISEGSSSSSRRWSGCSSSARIPLQYVALVLSLPAAMSRKNPITISCSSSFSPSISA